MNTLMSTCMFLHRAANALDIVHNNRMMVRVALRQNYILDCSGCTITITADVV